MAQRAGFEPTSHRLTAERVALATTSETIGCPRRYRASISWFRARHPAIERGGIDGMVGDGRSRTATYLRPRQVGYRLPYVPGVIGGSRTLLTGATTPRL